jgi:hypothetical protein
MLTNSITGAGCAFVLSLTAIGCGSSGNADRDDGLPPATEVMPNTPAAPNGPAAPSATTTPQPGIDTGAGGGTELLVSNDWVDGASNGVGVQGAFFVYVDHSNITTISATPGESQTGYCVSGEAAQVLNMDFGNFFGAVAALNLQQQPGVDTPGPYDAAAHGVTGFGFDIVGDTGGALRFVVKAFNVHDGYCINNVPDCATGCSVEYQLSELSQNCWTPGGALPPVNSLSALEWQITTNTNAAVPFDYCIENIHAVLAPPQ